MTSNGTLFIYARFLIAGMSHFFYISIRHTHNIYSLLPHNFIKTQKCAVDNEIWGSFFFCILIFKNGGSVKKCTYFGSSFDGYIWFTRFIFQMVNQNAHVSTITLNPIKGQPFHRPVPPSLATKKSGIETVPRQNLVYNQNLVKYQTVPRQNLVVHFIFPAPEYGCSFYIHLTIISLQ